MNIRTLYVSLLLIALWPQGATAQGSLDLIQRDRLKAASNYYAYPTPNKPLTPAPKGKKPFYISHYGRHGSRYLTQRKGYDIPYAYLAKGDSLGKLSPLGKVVKQEMETIMHDAEGYWGTLTAKGAQQHREITSRMITRFPEVFKGAVTIDARSTIVPRCILSMATAMNELVRHNPQLNINMQAAPRDMHFLNFQDKALRDSQMTHRAQEAYNAFTKPLRHNRRVADLLFNDTAYVSQHVDDQWLPYYLLKTALMQQNTDMNGDELLNIFTIEEIHQFWVLENVWWYICYGPSLLNGGCQPFTQRHLLRRIIADADSCIRQDCPGASLRYGHETVLLPLVCLLELNDFGFQTADLDEIEPHQWWACNVFPMGANLQLVFYRHDVNDDDVLLKVLLNEEEASLPLPTDQPPYYHWRDFREYCLKKLDNYRP